MTARTLADSCSARIGVLAVASFLLEMEVFGAGMLAVQVRASR